MTAAETASADTASSSRRRVIARVADHLIGRSAAEFADPARPGNGAGARPWRVAVDGITAAGKTTFADELAAAVSERGRPALRICMDGFHHPRARRHRQGRNSAAGYYQDAYDFVAFGEAVLTPLGPGGDRRYRRAVIDLATDEPVTATWLDAPADAVVIIDGSFLQRPELSGLWDDVIWLDSSVEAARARGSARDANQFGSRDAAERAYRSRYHAAFDLYFAEATPAGSASVVIGHDEPTQPQLRRIGAPGPVALFSYGTLQQPSVQQASFGRLLDSRPDELPRHRTEWLTITDPDVIAASGTNRHPLVRPSLDANDSVPGAVLSLTPTELAAADLYEVDDYRRVPVTLASGTQAWVYLAAATV